VASSLLIENVRRHKFLPCKRATGPVWNHVDDLVGHGLLDEHFVLRVDRYLRVVATPTFVWAAIARLSGSVRDIWFSPVRSELHQ
jgi:hypothetical protein